MAERENNRKESSRLKAGDMRCCLRFKTTCYRFLFILMGSNKRPSEKTGFRRPLFAESLLKKASISCGLPVRFLFLVRLQPVLSMVFPSAILSKSRLGSEAVSPMETLFRLSKIMADARWSDVRYTIAKPISSAEWKPIQPYLCLSACRIRLLDRLTRTWRPRL